MSANWQKRSLGELIKVQSGFAFKGSDFEDSGIPIIRMSDLNAGHLELNGAARINEGKLKDSSKFKLCAGDFLVGMSGSIGNYAIVREKDLPAYLNQRVGRFQLVDNKLADYDFITQTARSHEYKRHIELLAVGAAQVNISPVQIESFQFNLPPKPEQTKIAEILSCIDTAIEQTEAMIAKQQRIKTGLMQDLLSKGIDEHGNIRSEHTHAFKDSPLGRIPEEWEVSCCANMFTIDSGITLGLHRRPAKRPHAYLRVANIFRDEIRLNDVALLEAFPRDVNYCLKKYDLLVVEGHANRAEIGRCAMVYDDAEGMLFQNHLFRLRSINLDSHYALLWMNSHYAQLYWESSCATSSGLNTINRKMLGEMGVCVPSSQEQKKIVEVAFAMRDMVTKEINNLRKLKRQKTALMQDLLSGNVRVNQLLNSEEFT